MHRTPEDELHFFLHGGIPLKISILAETCKTVGCRCTGPINDKALVISERLPLALRSFLNALFEGRCGPMYHYTPWHALMLMGRTQQAVRSYPTACYVLAN